MGNDDKDFDTKKYDYLLQLHLADRDLFWSRINYYIIIETILLALYIGVVQNKERWLVIIISLGLGFAITFFMFTATLLGKVELAYNTKELSELESKLKVLGDHKIFSDEQYNKNNLVKMFGNNLWGRIFRHIFLKYSNNPIDLMLTIFVLLLCVWIFFIILYPTFRT
jgi:hypothetical protein